MIQRSHTPERVPYTMNLPDGRMVFLTLPAETVERDVSGQLMLTPDGGRLLDRVRALAMKTPARPSPAYLRTLRDALGLTQEQLAKKLSRSTVTIKRWEAGTLRPGDEAVAAIQRMVDSASSRGVMVAR